MRVILLASSVSALVCASGCSPTHRALVSATGTGGATSSGVSTSITSATSSSASGIASGGSSAQSSSTGGSTASSSAGGSTSSSSSGGTCTAMDCSDPACTAAGYACAAPAPTGWTGPGVFYLGTSAPPSCGADWMPVVTIGGTDPVGSPATCDACSCETPTGESCSGALVPVTLATNPTCTGGMLDTAMFGECVVIPQLEQQTWAQAGPVPATGGTCTAVGGQASTGTPSFTKQAGFCAAPTTALPGCTTGVCLSSPPAGYGAATCIYQTGDQLCPAPTYTQKTTVYSGFKDTRGCSPCACAVPAGATCTAQITLFNEATSCIGGEQMGPPDGTCAEFTAPPFGLEGSFRVTQSGAPTGGTCAASGGTPAGTVIGAMPVTVCCAQ